MTDEFLTTRELANWLKVKLPTVRLWSRQGLPCLRAGRLCRYERTIVRTWLEQRHQRTKSDREAMLAAQRDKGLVTDAVLTQVLAQFHPKAGS